MSIVTKNSKVSDEEQQRFSESERYYLETSAFNFVFDTLTLQEIELICAYMRRKEMIFVASALIVGPAVGAMFSQGVEITTV